MTQPNIIIYYIYSLRRGRIHLARHPAKDATTTSWCGRDWLITARSYAGVGTPKQALTGVTCKRCREAVKKAYVTT